MIGFLIAAYTLVLFFGVIILLDWISRGKDRQSRNRAA
jgi:hypothetical protein